MKEALKLALEALERLACLGNGVMRGNSIGNQIAIDALTAIKEALANHTENNLAMVAQPEQELVAVKHMMEWVDYLKRKSDYGQHMQIPSEMSAGACWDLAIELEQFINTTPPQRTWVGLTRDEVETLSYKAEDNTWAAVELAEAKLKEKNT